MAFKRIPSTMKAGLIITGTAIGLVIDAVRMPIYFATDRAGHAVSSGKVHSPAAAWAVQSGG